VEVYPGQGEVDGEGGPLVIVVAGGDPVAPADVADLPAGVPVVAADSGIDLALALGLHVTEAVGDFDSVSPSGLAAARAGGARIERHPAAKDRTDLDLALARALARGARRIVVVGGHGGRLDHFLANALLLSADRYAGVAVEARFGPARLHVVRRRVEVTGRVGDLVSLLAVGAAAVGVTTTGLRWALTDATVEPASSLGVSNELTASRATVTVRSGPLLLIQPGIR
jgi:thiamine pyrophosphokinase